VQHKLSAESSTRSERSEQHCRRQEGGTRFQIHLCAASLREARLAGSGSSAGAINCSNHGKAPGAPADQNRCDSPPGCGVLSAAERTWCTTGGNTTEPLGRRKSTAGTPVHYSTAETPLLVERRRSIIPWPLPAPPLPAPQPPLRPLPPRPRPHHRTELPSHPEAYLWKYQ